MTALKVDGSATTQPVSGTVTANAGTNLNTSALALESGGNLATLAGGVTSSVYQHNIKQVNGITVLTGTGATGTGSQRVTVATDSATVAGSATIPAGTNVIGKVGIDQTTPGTTNLVSAGQSGTWNIGTVTTVTGITSAFGATAASVPANVGYTGLRGTTANPTAVTDGQSVGAMGDKLGRQIVVPFQVRDNVGQQKTTITNTSETIIVTAIASVFCDVLSFNFSNTGATATAVHIRDTSGGSVVATFMVPAGDMRGQTYTIPFKQTTTNTNWTATCVSATTSMEITVQYVKNI